MNPVNGVNSNSDIKTLNPADMSKQDFISAVYLERSEMLDSEVRRIIGDIDKSNQYLDIVNTMIGKANIAEYGSNYYSNVTWKVQGDTVILDSGYALKVQPDGNGGSSFTIIDKAGNQLMYQNQTLIPIPKGTTVDVMNDMTFSLEDGTEITLKVDDPTTPFNQQDLSGGMANVASVIITRGNQGMIIENLNVGTPAVNAPTVENVVEVQAGGGVKSETVNVSQNQYQHNKTYLRGGSADNYTVIKNEFAPGALSELQANLSSMSQVDKDSLFAAIKANGGLTLNYALTESTTKYKNHYVNYTHKPTGNETLEKFITDAVNVASDQLEAYVRSRMSYFTGKISFNFASINTDAINLKVNLPSYSYEKLVQIPEKELNAKQEVHVHSLDSNNNDGHILYESGGVHSWEFGGKAVSHLTETISLPMVGIGDTGHALTENYQESTDYGVLQSHSDKFFNQLREQVVANLTVDQAEALRKTLMKDGLQLNWSVWDTSDASPSNHKTSQTYQLAYGESIDVFLARVSTANKEFVDPWIKAAEGDGSINITGVTLDTKLPDFAPVSPNPSDDTVSGYFARKLALQNSFNFEKTGGAPTMTQKEIELLNNILKIPYKDDSGLGQLTPSEWSALKASLINSRDHLTANSQLQTVQLQRAMKTYNQNFEAMSNAQQKIYSLLRDILSNLK